MKHHSRLILLINLLVITSLACGLSVPTPTAAPTVLPTQPMIAADASATPAAAQPTVTSVPATFTPLPPTETLPPPSPTPDLGPALAAPQPGQPLEALDLYAYNLATGEWTEGEGLAVLLGLLAGEIDPANIPYAADITDIELTPLFRRAERFLANTAADDPAAVEVARLLDKLVIPDERFDLYAEPTDVLDDQVTWPGAAHRARPARQFDDELCRQLFAEGFPEDSAQVCYRYARFSESGVDYRLYFPAGWSEAPGRLEILRAVYEAMRRSLQAFNAYGPQPIMPTRMVFTELNLLIPGTLVRSDNIYAKAIRGAASTCRVGIPPAGYNGENISLDELKQSVAHEMFHCYQYTNLSAQESGPDPAANEWWVEGGAEFFSDVVYPEVQFEMRWNGELPGVARDLPIVRWKYRAYLFFEYLVNHEGWSLTQLIDFWRSMPDHGGLESQIVALAYTANMNDIFHRFAQNFVKEGIRERSGTTIPTPLELLAPPFPLPAGSGNLELAVPIFRIGLYEVTLDRNLDYVLALTSSGGEGRYSTRPALALEWQPIPERFSSSCNNVAYQLLVTSAETPAYQVKLDYETTESSLACDACLVGLWSLDTASYLALVNYITPAESEAGKGGSTGVTGGLTMKLTDTGQFQAAFAPMTVNGFTMVRDALDSDNFIKFLIDVTFSGSASGTYSASEEMFSTAVTTNAINVTFTVNGQPGGRVNNAGMDPGAMLGGAQYICSTTSLILQPPPPVQAVKADPPWLVFTKVP
jgi:hypothetical protein